MLFAKAREMSAFALEDDVLDRLRSALDNSEMTGHDVRKLDLYAQGARWSAGKRNPNVFSDKAAVNVVVPVHIQTSLDLGKEGASGSTAEFPNIYEVRAQIAVEIEPDKPEAPAKGELPARRAARTKARELHSEQTAKRSATLRRRKRRRSTDNGEANPAVPGTPLEPSPFE